MNNDKTYYDIIVYYDDCMAHLYLGDAKTAAKSILNGINESKSVYDNLQNLWNRFNGDDLINKNLWNGKITKSQMSTQIKAGRNVRDWIINLRTWLDKIIVFYNKLHFAIDRLSYSGDDIKRHDHKKIPRNR